MPWSWCLFTTVGTLSKTRDLCSSGWPKSHYKDQVVLGTIFTFIIIYIIILFYNNNINLWLFLEKPYEKLLLWKCPKDIHIWKDSKWTLYTMERGTSNYTSYATKWNLLFQEWVTSCWNFHMNISGSDVLLSFECTYPPGLQTAPNRRNGKRAL